jgi:hypothetical protein
MGRARRMGTVAMSKPFIESGIPAMGTLPELLPAVCRPVAMAASVVVTGVRRVKAAVPSATRKAAKTAAYCRLVLGDSVRFACAPRLISRNHNGPASHMLADFSTQCSITQLVAVLGWVGDIEGSAKRSGLMMRLRWSRASSRVGRRWLRRSAASRGFSAHPGCCPASSARW